MSVGFLAAFTTISRHVGDTFSRFLTREPLRVEEAKQTRKLAWLWMGTKRAIAGEQWEMRDCGDTITRLAADRR